MNRLAQVLAASLVVAVPLVGCSSDKAKPTERWATTENTNVKLDWDKVNQAYKDANGPEDLEKRINEIYEGDEIISISVKDEDNKVQVVTGFFDKNTSGAIDEGEKIFTIKRELKSAGEAQYQTSGHGAYAGYHSPMLGLASGMMMGMMMSSMFMPSYSPMYSQPYNTQPGRVGQLNQSRSSYRASNPERFQKSQSGRSYNRDTNTGRSNPGRSSGGGRSGGGGRFGLARAGRTVRPRLLTA